MVVNISGTFRKDERESNGLEAIRLDLVEHGLARRVVVGLVETKFVKTDVQDGGTRVPTVKFVAIEPLTGASADKAREMLDEARRERTGQMTQPSLMDEVYEDDQDEMDLDEESRIGSPDFSEPEL